MTIDLTALVLAIVGPLITAWFAYRQRSRVGVLEAHVGVLTDNHLPHLITRLESIEQRLERVERWLFEHERDHSRP